VSERQLAWVIDLNKCLGCQACTLACKTHWTTDVGTEHQWWLIVNTLPGQGHPRGWQEMGGGYRDGEPLPGRLPKREEWGQAWDFNYQEVLEGGKGQQVHLLPFNPDGSHPSWGPNWEEDLGAGEYPNAYFFYLPHLCHHCSRPSCLDACPRDAIYKRPQDGLVLIDEERCNGCRLCVEACPYKRIYFNPIAEICQKCIGCYPRIEQGVAPACVRQCPGRAVWVGFLDDEEGAVYKLVRKWQVALPLLPHLGTQPNVYYVPPLSPPPIGEDGEAQWGQGRIPMEYLRRLFGPQVDQALATLQAEREKARSGQTSELMRILIAYRFQELLGPFTVNPSQLQRPVGQNPTLT